MEVIDREHPEVGWQPPARSWVEQNRDALQAAHAELKASLEPAPEAFIRECLARLGTYKPSRTGSLGEWKLKGHEYVRLLGHNPTDIWQEAVDECALNCKWFPDISELNAIMAPRFAERRRRFERLEAMLRTPLEHKPPPVAMWHKHEPKLIEAIGEADWRTWFSFVTPVRDDGCTLELAVPNRFFSKFLRETFSSQIEKIIQRRCIFVVRPGIARSGREGGKKR